MNMLKFGYGIVLDGLPDIQEFHFSGVWTPQLDPILFKCCIHISEILECLERHCLEPKHVGTHLIEGPIEKKNVSFEGREK